MCFALASFPQTAFITPSSTPSGRRRIQTGKQTGDYLRCCSRKHHAHQVRSTAYAHTRLRTQFVWLLRRPYSPYLLLPEPHLVTCGAIRLTVILVSRVHATELDDHAHQEGDGRSSPRCATRVSEAVCHDMPGHVSSAWYVLSDHLVDGEIEPDPMLLGFEHRNQHRKCAFGSASSN